MEPPSHSPSRATARPLWAVFRKEMTTGVMLAACIAGLAWLRALTLGVDPAVVSGPLITTLVDGTGLVIYLSVATALVTRLGG